MGSARSTLLLLAGSIVACLTKMGYVLMVCITPNLMTLSLIQSPSKSFKFYHRLPLNALPPVSGHGKRCGAVFGDPILMPKIPLQFTMDP